MNVSGPASAYTPPVMSSATAAARAAVARAVAGPSDAASVRDVAKAVRAGEPNQARASEPGATPRSGQTESLWDLLTPEERDFFTRAATMGPLTYRPTGKTHLGDVAPTGQRVDVRG